jgi:hypothetical protein
MVVSISQYTGVSHAISIHDYTMHRKNHSVTWSKCCFWLDNLNLGYNIYIICIFVLSYIWTMACIGAKSLILLAVCFCLFTPGNTQLPPWLGQLGNLNGTLSNLLRQLSRLNTNTTLPDLLARLNSTDAWRKMVEDISKSLRQIYVSSMFESRVMNSLQRMRPYASWTVWSGIATNNE